jgi:hypothetical protein
MTQLRYDEGKALSPRSERRNSRGGMRVWSATALSENIMAKAKKQTSRGRKQDRALVAGGQDYEVGYAAKKAGSSRAAVKKAVKKVGSSRKKVEKRLAR